MENLIGIEGSIEFNSVVNDIDAETNVHCLAESNDEYAGRYSSVAEFAWSLVVDVRSEIGDLSKYLDYQAIADDMLAAGEIYTMTIEDGAIEVFWVG